MSFAMTTEFLYDFYKVGQNTPLALIKKHPKGYMWHTFDKWPLGKQGKMIRHRSPVYEETRDAIASAISWFLKHNVDMREDTLKICKHVPQNGTDKHRIRDVDPATVSMAERLLMSLEPIPERILQKQAAPVPQPKAKETKIVPKSYAHIQRTASR